MSDPILEVTRLFKSFGGLSATDDLSLSIRRNETHAIIGPNGAGKTTLLAQLSGQLKPTSGSIVYQGMDITQWDVVKRVRRGIVRSFQITSLWPQLSVLENVMLAVQAQQGHAFHFFRAATAVRNLIGASCEFLHMVELEAKMGAQVYSLSHGEQRQLELAVALATRPDLLLLDEPLAGMGGDDSQRMVDLLHKLKGQYTIVLVEHDMDAVFSLADRISVLVYGRCVATDTPLAIRDNEEVRAAYLGEEAIC
ncbi:MAG TPA: ABC transporter ATP-binding protein [Eoetvoesiella sp.]|uniref:ABC transporter ATP-binding protein n=1 Tax=Eoetvoesiella sp. TaxID=1966355 RepID=UPI002C144D8A|nr:ABC transporter ATP-binding protein [Eoetvoesiella sp.]HWK61279.1 ABC transporter ATP-binding protein [Eoetvoesiella sp.]